MLRKLAFCFSILAAVFILVLGSALAFDAVPGLLGGMIFKEGYWDFRWQSFHSLSMFFGTFSVATMAVALSFPLGLGAAIYLSEYLSGKSRTFAKILIELLAGIPSVVYGLIGVAFLLPWLSPLIMKWGGASGDCLIAAGCLLAIMILPTFVTFADDALRCVPYHLRNQGYGLGLSKTQVILSIVVPQAKSGIAGAVMLSFGRALGETIAIYLVIGRADLPFSFSDWHWSTLLQSGQTITTKLGGSELAIAYGDTVHWQSLMSLGLCLWLVVGLFSYVSESIIGRRR